MTGGARATPFPPDLVARLADVVAEHQKLPIPGEAGRALSLVKTKQKD
jgi:hypothetical protein